MGRVVLGFLLIIACCGCMVGPKYRKPEICLPAQFEELREEAESEEDLSEWWEQFNDPLLDCLIEEAIAANYDFRLAVERIWQARAQYRVERSYLWPEIDLNASASRTRISQNLFPSPAQPSSTAVTPNAPATAASTGSGFLPAYLNIFQLGLDAIWEMDFFGKFRHAKNAAQDYEEATEEDAKSILITLVSEVAVNYVNIRALQQELALADAKIQIDEKEFKITRSLFEEGLANEIQVDDRMAQLTGDRAVFLSLEISLRQTIYALAYLLGKAPEGFVELFEESRPIPAGWQRIPVGLPSDLLRRRPDVKGAERRLSAATEQVGEAIADLFPHIALTGISLGAGNKIGSSYGYESSEWHNFLSAPSRMFSFGVGMNWNLLDFGRVRAHIDVTQSLQRQALLTYEKTVMEALKDVDSALVAYFNEEERRKLLVEKVTINKRSLEVVEQRHEIGLATEIEVLNIRKVLLDAESGLIQSEQALTGDLIAVYKALGGSWKCM